MKIIISENQLKRLVILEQTKNNELPRPYLDVLKYESKKKPTEYNSVSKKGIEIIKNEEKFVPKQYIDATNNLTIGYGTLVKNHEELKKMKQITEPIAEKYLMKHVNSVCIPTIHRNLKIPITQSQLDALCSLIYNIGQGNFVKSDLLKSLNSSNFEKAKKDWMKWSYGGTKVLRGLEKRRRMEIQMFFGK